MIVMSSKLLIGLAAGVVIGVLFAPDKGSETRRKIVDKGNDLKNKFNDFVDSLADKVDDLADDANEYAQEAKAKFS